MRGSRREFLRAAAGAGAGVVLGPLAGCRANVKLPGAVSAPAKGVTGKDSLRAHGAAAGLLVGCAVNVERLGTDAAYAALVREQAGIVTAENAMKWAALRPTISTYDFDQGDALIAFAEANGMKVRGHNLCWHRQLPRWFAAEVNAGNARAVLEDHIAMVAGRYAGRMHSWDVVNEAVLLKDGRADGLRDSPWLKLIGADYIEVAFQAARAADPQALLTYNDYGIEAEDEASQAKRSAVLLLLRRLKARDVPIDAVGVQSHVSAGAGKAYGAGLLRFMAEVRELELEVFCTELDVNDRALPADDGVRDKAVAERYGSYVGMMLDHGVDVVVTWGITDRYTWLNGEDSRADHLPERCLPFDAECNPVPAFFALRDALDERLGG